VYDQQDYITPDHIRELAEPVIAHRLAIEPQARFSGLSARGVVRDVLKKVAAPT
jgi:MoxR-like ATPase